MGALGVSYMAPFRRGADKIVRSYDPWKVLGEYHTIRRLVCVSGLGGGGGLRYIGEIIKRSRDDRR